MNLNFLHYVICFRAQSQPISLNHSINEQIQGKLG